jgi:uncharacterized protein with GYD domain
MARYVLLLNWTDQGIRAVKDTVKRATSARQMVEKMGGRVNDSVWTLGAYDLVLSVEAPDDETITAMAIKLATLGNVRTTTLRAFNESEMEKILKKV